MTVTQLLSHLRTLGVHIWVDGDRLRYQAPKGTLSPALLEELALHKQDLLTWLRSTAPPAIQTRAREGPLPLSFAQERLWLIDQMAPGRSTFNIPIALRLVGRLDETALQRSITEVVQRHEVLRTTFEERDGHPVQTIGAHVAVPLPVVDLSILPAHQRDAEAQRVAQQEGLEPFNLARGPLLRTKLVRLDSRHHILLVTVHHIAADGWSLRIFFQELNALYTALAHHERMPLSPLPVQYTDYAQWQREWFQGSVLDTHLSYWRKRLSDSPPVLDMPVDRPRTAEATYEAGRESLLLTASLTGALMRLSQHASATLFMTLLAAFKVVLHRYSAQTDIVVGTPISGRSQPVLEDLIGIFLNTLVLRSDLSGNPTFRELLARARTTCLEAYSHQDLPFEKLLAELQPERHLSLNPLFQVFFNMLNLPAPQLQMDALELELLASPEVGAKFDLTVYVAEKGDRLQIDAVYNTYLFEAERMREMLDQYGAVLEQVVRNPDERIGNLSLLTPAFRQRLPDPRQPLPVRTAELVPQRLARHSERTPERVALRDDREAWTFAELDLWTNRLARYLSSEGLQPHDVVAVYGSRSAGLVWALLGILKAGAAFTIIDPAYPVTRQVAMLELAQARALLRAEAAGALPGDVDACVARQCRCSLVLPPLETAKKDNFLGAGGDARPPASLDLDDLAYVAFTSGSTGRPKAILGAHRPLCHFLEWHTQCFELNETDRFSLLSGLSHDPLLRDILTPLWLGAQLCIPDPARLADPGWLARWMGEQRISVAHLTPAMAQLLTMSAERVVLADLRYAFFGGDLLTQQEVAKIQSFAPSATCVNFYGATETPQAMSYWVVPGEQAAAGREEQRPRGRERMPLGRGIDGVQLLVLNSAQQLAGMGELGEIYIRTPYLSLGYLNDDSATAERFLSNPFTHAADDRVYRTGDLGRYLPDGTVEFCGRADQQIKLRGFRIELEEIEAALNRHPGVLASAVKLCEDRPGNKWLAAFVVPREGAAPSAHDLRQFLQTHLPDYMVPAAFILQDVLPMTENGKVDRRRLPIPEKMDLSESLVAPRTPTEEQLAAIWREVLGSERVGVFDNFFDLGGHSLLAVQLLARVRAAFGVEIALRGLFEAPTIAGLAEKVAGAQRLGRTPVPPLRRMAREGPIPLSLVQEPLWFLDQLEPGNPFYNLGLALRFTGALDREALQRSLDAIIQRHEVLRTTFGVVDGRPVQSVAPSLELPIKTIDLHGVPEGKRHGTVRQVIGRELRHSFDLRRGPLLQLKLLNLAESEHVLVLCVHHIISDLWSLGVFARELVTFYQRFAVARSSPASDVDLGLPPLPVQYADFALWQRGCLDDDFFRVQLDYWKSQLAGELPLLDLPADYPRPATQTYRGDRIAFSLPETLHSALVHLSTAERVTLFDLLLSAFECLLHLYSGQEDLIIGTRIAGRGQVELEPLMGAFVKALVLRVNLSGNPSFREVLERVKQVTLDAYAHQELPFERLVQELNPARDPSRNPIFQIMFTLQNIPLQFPTPAGLKVEVVPPEHNGTAKFDLDLAMAESNGTLNGTVEYNTAHFDSASIRTMIEHYRAMLERIVAEPDRHLRDLALLAESEQSQLIRGNETEADYGVEQCLHRLFEAQAERTPDRVALVFEQEQLSYRELNRRANQLARYLRRLGVGPEVAVAVCLERSPFTVIGLLAVLKAGGVYVPLDPNFPLAHLAHVLEDTRAAVVVTKSQWSDRLSGDAVKRVGVDQDGELMAQEEGGNLGIETELDQLACVFYTSGSTGQPKGVATAQRAIINRLAWMWETFPFGQDETLCLRSTVSFLISMWELLGGLLRGVPTVVLPEEIVRDPGKLIDAMSQHAVTRVVMVPSLLRTILDTQADLQSRLPEVRYWITCGEPLARDLHHSLCEKLPQVRVINQYGSSEVNDIMCYDTSRESVDRPYVPVGRPIGNTRAYLLDRQLRPVPAGVPGEVYISGAALARGYLHRPDLTAEKFLPDPFSSRPGSRLYHMGDRARYLPNGAIEYLGRQDSQVKIRGVRVEIAGIEALLGEHPEVSRAIVVALPDPLGNKRLAAYVVPKVDGGARPQDLRAFLRKRVPEQMVPSTFVRLTALPLTPNGKVNRRALPPPESALPESEGVQSRPQSELERLIASVWAQVLGVPVVDVNSNFFDLGGHSLLMARAHHELETKLDRELNMLDVFRYPTIRALARYLAGPPSELTDFDKVLQMAASQIEAFGQQSEANPSDQADPRAL